MKQPPKKLQKKTFEYKLKGIELLSVDQPIFSMPSKDPVLFTFDVEINNKVNVELKLVFSIVNITIKHHDKRIGGISTSCFFEVLNYSEFVTLNKDEKYEIYPPLTEELNHISIGTSRGVMFAQFKGTTLHNAFLPIIAVENKVETFLS